LTSARQERSNLLNSLFQGYLKLKEMYPILKALLKYDKIKIGDVGAQILWLLLNWGFKKI